MACADGGFNPNRMTTEARVSPRRNLTPTRSDCSGATDAAGLGSSSLCFGFINGEHSTKSRVAIATLVKRSAASPKRFAKDSLKNLRCFIWTIYIFTLLFYKIILLV